MGMAHSRPNVARCTARHVSLGKPDQPKDRYESTVGRLGSMVDRGDRKAGAPSKVGQFTVCALRGFGIRKVTMAIGTYDNEMESCLVRQARSGRDRFRRAKLKIPIAGNVASDGANAIDATMGGCVSPESARYRACRWGGEKNRAAQQGAAKLRLVSLGRRNVVFDCFPSCTAANTIGVENARPERLFGSVGKSPTSARFHFW